MQDFFHQYPLAPVFFFPVFWCAIMFLIAALTGWMTLARRFRLSSAFTGPTLNFQTARMRWSTHYGSCLNVGADPTGLMLSVLFIFRVGHPPLFLPWHEISVAQRGKFVFSRQVRLLLGREEQIPFTISEGLAGRIQAAAGRNWPTEAVH